MQVSEWHNRSAKVGGIRRDCLREQGGPGARQLPRVSTSLASLSRLSSPSLPNHLFLTIYARLFFPFDVRSPLSPLFSPSRSFSTIVLSIYMSILLPRSWFPLRYSSETSPASPASISVHIKRVLYMHAYTSIRGWLTRAELRYFIDLFWR